MANYIHYNTGYVIIAIIKCICTYTVYMAAIINCSDITFNYQ